MAIGYAHLFALPTTGGDSAGLKEPAYQFTFSTGGIAYGKVLAEDELLEFLADELGLREDVINDGLQLLRTEGKVTIPDVKLSENDAAVMGLMEVGVDY
jgi:hypothetical protein